MEVKFANDYLENLYTGVPTNGKPKYQIDVVEKFVKRIDLLKQVDSSKELLEIRSLNFEKLKGDKKDLFSIRVNKQYRIEFKLENDVINVTEIAIVEELSKHYEK